MISDEKRLWREFFFQFSSKMFNDLGVVQHGGGGFGCMATGRNPRGGKNGGESLDPRSEKNPGFTEKMDPKGGGGWPHHGVKNAVNLI